jgi:hypothetical protein
MTLIRRALRPVLPCLAKPGEAVGPGMRHAELSTIAHSDLGSMQKPAEPGLTVTRSGSSSDAESPMSSMIQQASLPRRFPVGAVYVVEGTGGGYGHLRVSSRYVILPGGRRIDVAANPDRAESSRVLRRRQVRNALQDHGKNRLRGGGPKASASSPKKFRVVAGTDR